MLKISENVITFRKTYRINMSFAFLSCTENFNTHRGLIVLIEPYHEIMGLTTCLRSACISIQPDLNFNMATFCFRRIVSVPQVCVIFLVNFILDLLHKSEGEFSYNGT